MIFAFSSVFILLLWYRGEVEGEEAGSPTSAHTEDVEGGGVTYHSPHDQKEANTTFLVWSSSC